MDITSTDLWSISLFFFNDTATTEIYTLSLHDALPICGGRHKLFKTANESVMHALAYAYRDRRNKKRDFHRLWITRINADRKSTRLNSSHANISYAVFCLKKKTQS